MLCIWRFTSILGTVVALILMSVNDRLERKKYMGVWSVGIRGAFRMMSRFLLCESPGTWTGRVQRGGAEALVHLRVPAGGILRHV